MDQQNNNHDTIDQADANLRPEDVAPGAAPASAAPEVAAPARLQVDADRYANPEIEDPSVEEDEDDAPTEWVPSRFEKRIKAIPEGQWKLYQTLAGIVIGAFTAGTLFLGGSGKNYLFLVAIVVALAGPNVLEDRGRRKLNRFRIVLIIVMAVSIIAFGIYMGVTHGWNFRAQKEATEGALRLVNRRLA